MYLGKICDITAKMKYPINVPLVTIFHYICHISALACSILQNYRNKILFMLTQVLLNYVTVNPKSKLVFMFSRWTLFSSSIPICHLAFKPDNTQRLQYIALAQIFHVYHDYHWENKPNIIIIILQTQEITMKKYSE